MRKYMVVALAVITSFLFGGGFMYLIDSTWAYNRVEWKKEQLKSQMTRYADALDVSHKMVNNCHDAFYAVSNCSTKDGCDLVFTADSLSELNLERKILKLRLNQLLDGAASAWSK